MVGTTDRRPVSFSTPGEPRLWLLAVVLFGVGDLVTTSAGLGVGAAEVNPLARFLIARHGLGAMVALKLLSLGCCLGLWSIAPRPYRLGIPLGLAILGGLVNAWNVLVVGFTFLVLS